MVLESIFYILFGFLLLVKGGDYLIDGSVSLAKRAKLSKMVIGIVVIGFGTSTPELFVSTQAAIIGSPGFAIGNVVGSKIANIALILGVTSIICPLAADRMMLIRDMPFMMLAVLLLVIVGMSGDIYRWEGLMLIAILLSYVLYQIKTSRKNEKKNPTIVDSDFEKAPLTFWKALLLVIFSIAALIAGSNMLINGSADIAMKLGTALGVDVATMERVIGLTIVAVGTSLPELTATVMAARKNHVEMALGNIIGSVSFNILCVIGVASVVTPIHNTNTGFCFDYAVMLSLTVLLWYFLFTEHKLVRAEGWILSILYLMYITRTLFIL